MSSSLCPAAVFMTRIHMMPVCLYRKNLMSYVVYAPLVDPAGGSWLHCERIECSLIGAVSETMTHLPPCLSLTRRASFSSHPYSLRPRLRRGDTGCTTDQEIGKVIVARLMSYLSVEPEAMVRELSLASKSKIITFISFTFLTIR